jgi:DNA-binding NarL/FixJ family response regulator
MKSIIIVEDHPLMQKGLLSYFSGTGRWKVSGTASSLNEAKHLLCKISTESPPDVLLLDIQLKDGWGLDIIPWLKEQQTDKIRTGETQTDAIRTDTTGEQQALPLMAIYTSFDDYAHVSTALSMGVKVYITKLRSEQELEAALLNAFSGIVCIDENAQMKLQNVKDVFSMLTKREAEIVLLVKKKFTNKQIAAELDISHRTVENILSCVYDKMGIKSRKELEV